MFNLSYRITVIVFFLISLISWCQPQHANFSDCSPMPRMPEFMERPSPWADSVFLSLSLRERIAQLFMISAYSNKTEKTYKHVEGMIKTENVGGLIFFQGGPVRQASLTNRYQRAAKTPMMIAMDAEWGLNMRLPDSAMVFPQQMQLGAIANDSLIRAYGKQIGKQCNAIGVNVNFAPVVDVNNNPWNPVINTRSFGELPNNVARKGWAYASGMQSRLVLPVAKHFPGHGDTNSDSHKTLPKVAHDRARLDSVELVPFKYMIDKGVGGIMNAHLYVPALDATPKQASSISPKVVGDLLHGELGFKGLAFTDALGMKGLSAYNSLDESVVKAFKAGNDILLMPKNLLQAIDALEKAVQEGKVSKREIDSRCLKVLKAKEWMALHKREEIPVRAVPDLINSSANKRLRQELIEASVVVAENKDSLLPLRNLQNMRIASLAIGKGKNSEFQQTLGLYTHVDHFAINKYADKASFQRLKTKLAKYDVVIVGFHSTLKSSKKSFGITKRSLLFLRSLALQTKVVTAVFARPYSLRLFKRENLQAVILAHRDNVAEQRAAAQIIFGGLEGNGQMPVSAGDFKAGESFRVQKSRLAFSAAESQTFTMKEKLHTMDSLVERAIFERMMPGCQIIAVHKGRVFLNKTYGYHTYDKKRKVKANDLYDFASLTKISATLFSVMHLVEQGKINLDEKLSTYFERAKGTNKADLVIRDLLLHQSGLKSWVPFYQETFNRRSKKLDPKVYATAPKDNRRTKMAHNLYILDTYQDTIVQRILDTELQEKVYRYSDLGFILLKEMVEEITRKTIDEYADSILFKPLATELTFNPWKSVAKARLVPSEFDHVWRKQVVRGYVHDHTAAQFGGVSGHAGLFGSALDLTKLMQMYLQGGFYGGKRFVSDSTMYEFTRCHYCLFNRRGLGFDKPSIEGGVTTSVYASQSSFGHSGFVGGYTWADPDHDLLFVFLANRTYPSADNNKIIRENLRTHLLDLVYEAVHEDSEGKKAALH